MNSDKADFIDIKIVLKEKSITTLPATPDTGSIVMVFNVRWMKIFGRSL